MLERAGNWVDYLLEISPYSAPFSRLGKIRSAGVTDLRYGNVIDEHWRDRCRFEKGADQRSPVPLPEHVECYAIAGTSDTRWRQFDEDVVGDGLVTTWSAFGHHKNLELALNFKPAHCHTVKGISHFDLLSDREVYDKIVEYLT